MPRQEELGETQILAALLGIAEMVGGLSDTEEILASIVRITPSLVRVDRCALMTYHEDTREFRTAVAFGPAGAPNRYEGLVLQEADMPRLAQRVVKLRLPVLMKDASKDALLPPEVIQRLGLRSVLVAPVVCRGHLLGSLWLDSTKWHHYFTSKEINVVLGIATEAAIALDNARLTEDRERVRRRFTALAGALCDGVIAVDPHLRIVELDRGTERLLGWTTSETRGRRMWEVFDVSEGEASIGWTKDDLGPSPTSKNLRLRAHDGTRIECQMLTAVIRDEDGAIVEILYALRAWPGTRAAEDRAVEALAQLEDTAGRSVRPE